MRRLFAKLKAMFVGGDLPGPAISAPSNCKQWTFFVPTFPHWPNVILDLKAYEDIEGPVDGRDILPFTPRGRK